MFFHKNNYNADFFGHNTHQPTETDEMNRNPTSLTTVTIPYIKGTSETITSKTGTNLTTDREQFTR